jgi:hypothetical protein
LRKAQARPGAARDTTDDPPGAVPVQPASIRSHEDRSCGAFADGQVDRPLPVVMLDGFDELPARARATASLSNC